MKKKRLIAKENDSQVGFDYNKARSFLIEKEEARIKFNHKLYNKACADFNHIVAMLIKKYNPKRIYQWGSLLNKEDFSAISDVDIAVEGVKSAEEFFQMYGDAEELTQFPLDLIEIEKIDPLHAETIKKYGKLVYERTK